ncbi:MAG: hypothetical protein AAGB31_01370 [Bdellovibrio sp.]
MRHIQNKNDWFYEFRPMLIAVVGTVGLLNHISVVGNANMLYCSQVCGGILLFCAYKINHWRKEYRKALL